MIAHFSTQQFVNRHTRSLAGNIPQRHLNRTDRAAPWFETAQPPDFTHHALDIGWILTKQILLVKKNMRFEIRLGILHFTIAIDTFVCYHAHDRVLTDHSTFEIKDFHGAPYSSLYLILYMKLFAP